MLTPQDIQNQQFHVRFRGFDTDEVDEFLEQAAATVQELQAENRELKSRLENAERRVAAYKRQEKTAMGAILSAQNVAQEMKEKAREEAREVLAKAREEAKGLEESAGREISELEREVDRLRGIKAQVRAEMRQVLENHLARLEAEPDTEESTVATGAGPTPAFTAPGTAADAEKAASDTTVTDSTHDELYQRIELADDLLPPLTGEAPATAQTLEPEKESMAEQPASVPAAPSSQPLATADKQGGEDDDNMLPDLDGDMVFNLEDPLDDEEENNQEEGLGRGPVISLDDEFADEPETDPEAEREPNRS